MFVSKKKYQELYERDKIHFGKAVDFEVALEKLKEKNKKIEKQNSKLKAEVKELRDRNYNLDKHLTNTMKFLGVDWMDQKSFVSKNGKKEEFASLDPNQL